MGKDKYVRDKEVPKSTGYIIKPLIVTLKQTIRSTIHRPNTVLYPWEKLELPDCYRGRPGLIMEKCIGCGICARICPNKCISLIEIEHPELGKIKRPEVDVGRCMLCGYCAEYCPKNAMTVTPEYELATESREDLKYDPYKLQYEYKPGYEVDLVEILPSEMGERVEARKMEAKDVPVLDEEECIGCRRCMKVCPADAVEMIEVGEDEKGRTIRIPEFDYSKCVSCGNCVRDCPKDALTMKEVL